MLYYPQMKNVIVLRTGALGTWREKNNGITDYAKAAGWRLHSVDARTAKPNIRRLVDHWKPDGAIVDASALAQMFPASAFGKIPVVVMNPTSKAANPGHLTVMHDSAAIARLAVAELLKARPKSLLFVEWTNPESAWSKIKRETTCEIAHKEGIPLIVVTPARGDAEDITRLEDRIADALETAPRPCGVFAALDLFGAAAISAASRIGASIPEDVSIISVDDNPEICESCLPPLTSVKPDFHKFGFVAARLLDDAMAHKGTSLKCVAIQPVGVVRRASTMKTKVFNRTASEALEQIRLHACTGLTPKDVAKPFNRSRRMAEIRFKAATGKTMGEAILEQRLSTACDYLRDGKSSVCAIANFCGWKSDRAFRKAFVSRFGVAPREWRKSNSHQ